MDIQNVVEILSENDGSLPDIVFDFGAEKCVASAYQLIQQHSTYIVSETPYYWSNSHDVEVPILFGQNLAEMILSGEAQSFHLVFGGIRSPSGKSIPDLGIFIYNETLMSLNYRMGNYWNAEAVEGLFEIMSLLKLMSFSTKIEHLENLVDRDGTILLSAFNNWLAVT
jgi:hypothetical protein